MPARVEWSGYPDTKRLLPRPSDPRVFPFEDLVPKCRRLREGPVSVVEYMQPQRYGYRLIAALTYAQYQGRQAWR
jgi:hypothetical protein